MKNNTIFIHIPKCGGSTLRDIMYRCVGVPREQIHTISRTDDIPAFIALPEEEKKKIRALIGHGRYGLHQHLLGPSAYVTFLREPIDRCVSAYYYDKSFPQSITARNQLSLREYYEGNHGPWDTNIQTKKLAGVECDITPCSEEVFEQAMANLDGHIDFVGFVEHFDHSIIALRDVLGWSRTPYYQRINVTRKRNPVESLSQEDIELLQRLNSYDIRLYEHARKKFLEPLLSETNSRATVRFQQRNRTWGRWVLLFYRAKAKLGRM